MENRNLKRFVHFSPDSVVRETVFETDRLWAQVLCFDHNQTIGPMIDPDSDALFTIVAGEAVFLVDAKRKRLEQWGTVLIEANSRGDHHERVGGAPGAAAGRGAASFRARRLRLSAPSSA